MQFNSIDFMLFFPVVLGIYFIIPRTLRSVWLLIASYYFYMSWNPQYALLIAGTTFITWICGIIIDLFRRRNTNKKSIHIKVILVLCLIVNLSVLAVFKYGNFVMESVEAVLLKIGITSTSKRFDFLLPVGISFYTFQALGYIIDVYREDVEVEKNFFRYALFVSFFPQLVAGPIERSKNLLAQMKDITQLHLWDYNRIVAGGIQIIWGLFMKMVIADRVAILVDTVFNDYRMYGSSELILAIVGFALQVYCDFASYSLIAIGAAKIMGFNLMENFDAPYLSRNTKELWNRWHISLNTWFKDYLYFPLGGSRKGLLRKNINLMIVFLVSGLWHGANWTFVIWGGLNGLYRIIGDYLSPYKEKIIRRLSVKTDCFSWKLLETLTTFCMFCFALIFFRSDTIRDALRFIKRIIIRPTPWTLFNGGIYTLGLDRVEMNILLFAVALLLFVDFVKVINKQTVDEFLVKQNLWFEWVVIIMLVWMLFVFGEYGPAFDTQQFLYFQF